MGARAVTPKIGEAMEKAPEGYEYVATDGGVRIVRCAIGAQHLVMPEYIDGAPVTSIAPRAFEGNAVIRDLVCPPQVVEIGERAFAESALRTFASPGSLRIIRREAFAGCQSLREVVLAEGITCIEPEAFMRCERLRSVNLPTGLRELGDRAFATTALSSCIVPASVERLGECALAFNFKNWHPTTNPPESRAHVTLEPGNSRYFVERSLLYERCEGGTVRAVLYVGPDIDVTVMRNARSIAPYAFFGVQGIRELRLPAGILTGEATFAMRKPPERIVIEGDGGIVFDTMHDWRGVCALQRAFAGDGTTSARLLCTTFDEEALSAQLDYEAFRYMLTRLARPDYLEATTREAFVQVFRDRLADACIAFARYGDRVSIDDLVNSGLISEANIDRAIEAASTASSAPIMARLHELKRTRFQAATRDYEL